MMILDYWYVMNQIDENKELKVENRRLRQQVQIFRNKMANIESTMDRIRTLSTRLKVITNIGDREGLVQRLQGPIPDAASNIPAQRSTEAPVLPEDFLPESAPETSSGPFAKKDAESRRIERFQAELDQQFT